MKRFSAPLGLALAIALAGLGCANFDRSGIPLDGGSTDAGIADARIPDAGVADATLADATLADATLADAGVADAAVAVASSCMTCHNGSDKEDYAGSGISNPHPSSGSVPISCVTCHGGDPLGQADTSHVPPPPAIGDRLQRQNDAYAYFNRLTLIGLDKLGSYTVGSKTYDALDYLQFVNPGDLRVVSANRSCGRSECHGNAHVKWVSRGPMATGSGIYSAPLYAAGLPNAQGYDWYQNTAADYGFRAVDDPDFVYNGQDIGRVGMLQEFSEKARYGIQGGIYQNPDYDALQLGNNVYAVSQGDQRANQIIPGTRLADLFQESIAITCGGCHLGSAGANNRYGDFRSSGCTACHMEYSYDGRARSTDPWVSRLEPANPDAIQAPERPHIEAHQIRNVAKVLPGGGFLRGISDKACVGCHQGTNRTVLQYWGIRLDQNLDLANGLQYPANPATFVNTANDARLFDPIVGNNTFNGRNSNQYILKEDYDGDGRDDTPPDIHYERGLGCIDCHGSRDMHNGTEGDPTSGRIVSRQDQTVAIECESCHGGIADYAATDPCIDYDGKTAECAMDRNGNPLRNVTVDNNGDFWLRGRVDGQPHYVPQTRDTIVNDNKRHPVTGQLLYSPIASYAMGRADGNALTGIGPQQSNGSLVTPGFAHTNTMDCASCHSSWSNTCIGCHLAPRYDANPANYFFSRTTGERIVLSQADASYAYITPIPFFLGVGSRNRITQTMPGMGLFFRYEADINGNRSGVLAFTDRNGNGNNPNHQGRGRFGALGHNKLMPHSQRGRVSGNSEGPRYCVSCHLNVDQMNIYGTAYAQFYADMQNGNVANLNFTLLKQQIGQNPGNQKNSPFFVHMVAGLGSGLFFFDADGCPVNSLDQNPNRAGCQGQSPFERFSASSALYALDRLVEQSGIANASSSHPLLDGNVSASRDGALDPGLAGPLSESLVKKLADPNTGLILDGWIDANGVPQGSAQNFIN